MEKEERVESITGCTAMTSTSALPETFSTTGMKAVSSRRTVTFVSMG